MVNVNDQAPDFELEDQNKKKISLGDYSDTKVLLAFYPFAFSPVCSAELKAFQDDLLQFSEKNVSIVGISVDSSYSNKAFADSLGLHIPLLSDFSKKVCSAYGVLRSEGFSERAYFLVDAGKITFKKIMDSPGDKLENSDLFHNI